MPDSVQTLRANYIRLDTDFGYDALGGVGRLGEHRMEVLTTGARQTDRVPGPPKTIGRWFSKLLDSLTPSSWRAQGKFRRGLEEFSAQTGRILGQLCNAGRRENDVEERQEAFDAAFKELAGLRRAAEPMTSRGTDYAELLQTRVRRNLAILREENPALMRTLLQVREGGLLDEAIAGLDPVTQGDMAEDLALIRDVLNEEDQAAPPRADENAVLSQVEARAAARSGATAEETAPADPPYQPRFSAASLKAFFLEQFSFKARAQQALQERQATLGRFAAEAGQYLGAALEEVDRALNGRIAADVDSFAQVQQRVDEKMGRAIRCATDEVCSLALQQLDRRASVGQDGQDFKRIDGAFVRRKLDGIERAVRAGEAVQPEAVDISPSDAASADPFQKGIQDARRQIQDLSALYGELAEGLSELERRNSRARSCLLLQDLLIQAKPPEYVTRRRFGEVCDALIDAIRTPAPGNQVAEGQLQSLSIWMEHATLPQALRDRFSEALPELRRNLLPDRDRPVFGLREAARAKEQLVRLEQARALHQAVGDAGALLQRASVPQADSLVSQGLQISRLAMQLRNAQGQMDAQRVQAIKELRTSVSRFMSNMALTRMQMANPLIRSAQPEAKALDMDVAQEGLALLQRGIEMLVGGLREEEGGVVARAAMNDGARLVEKAEAAAIACGKLQVNIVHKEKGVAEQLAVCVESGRDDAEATLRGMMEGSRWDKGKHSEAKTAINEFLEALQPVRESRGQSALLRFLAKKLHHNIVAHDVYMGFDGSIHMLINTDRQNAMGESKTIQGTRWITLPSPDRIQPGVSTGVNRLDTLLATGDNLTEFYPLLHRILNEYFSGIRYDFDAL